MCRANPSDDQEGDEKDWHDASEEVGFLVLICLYVCVRLLGFRRKPTCSHGTSEQHTNEKGLLPNLTEKGSGCGIVFSFICSVFSLQLWFLPVAGNADILLCA